MIKLMTGLIVGLLAGAAVATEPAFEIFTSQLPFKDATGKALVMTRMEDKERRAISLAAGLDQAGKPHILNVDDEGRVFCVLGAAQ